MNIPKLLHDHDNSRNAKSGNRNAENAMKVNNYRPQRYAQDVSSNEREQEPRWTAEELTRPLQSSCPNPSPLTAHRSPFPKTGSAASSDEVQPSSVSKDFAEENPRKAQWTAEELTRSLYGKVYPIHVPSPLSRDVSQMSDDKEGPSDVYNFSKNLDVLKKRTFEEPTRSLGSNSYPTDKLPAMLSDDRCQANNAAWRLGNTSDAFARNKNKRKRWAHDEYDQSERSCTKGRNSRSNQIPDSPPLSTYSGYGPRY